MQEEEVKVEKPIKENLVTSKSLVAKKAKSQKNSANFESDDE
jgi:hypothetical protein